MSMKIFVDTNVMVDLLARCEPFYTDAARLFSLVDMGKCIASVAALSFSTTAYLLEKRLSYEDLAHTLRQFASIVEIAAIDERTVRKSLSTTSLSATSKMPCSITLPYSRAAKPLSPAM